MMRLPVAALITGAFAYSDSEWGATYRTDSVVDDSAKYYGSPPIALRKAVAAQETRAHQLNMNRRAKTESDISAEEDALAAYAVDLALGAKAFRNEGMFEGLLETAERQRNMRWGLCGRLVSTSS